MNGESPRVLSLVHRALQTHGRALRHQEMHSTIYSTIRSLQIGRAILESREQKSSRLTSFYLRRRQRLLPVRSAGMDMVSMVEAPRSWIYRLIKFYEATQVELHGQYSIHHLNLLHEYVTSDFNAERLIGVLVATPWPCLVVILLFEALPLEKPSLGPNKNVVFWLRIAATQLLSIVAGVAVFLRAIPEAQLSRVQFIGMTVIATAVTQVFNYIMSLAIGFPVPFILVIGEPVWLSTILASLNYTSGRSIRESATGRTSVRDWFLFTQVIVSLLLFFTLYTYLYIKASALGQTALSLLLAVMKIAYKNAISWCFREQSDLKAELVNFNVEILNALFVTFSMQNARSVATLAVLLLIDFLHACATLFEVHRAVAGLSQLEREIGRRGGYFSFRDQRPSDVIYSHDSSTVSTLTVIRRARVIMNWQSMQNAFDTAWSPVNGRDERIVPVGSRSRLLRCLGGPKIEPSPTTPAARARSPLSSSVPPISIVPNNESSKAATEVSVTALEEEYADKILRLLHLTEFTMLTEYIEFVVPLIYVTNETSGLYIAVMVHLPNRIYFPQFETITSESIDSNVVNVLVYSLLEFFSLVLLDWMLRRQLRFSPIVQLAFVLGTNWRSVQAALMMWVIYISQSSLEHYGVDYTFQFSWLHANTTTP